MRWSGRGDEPDRGILFDRCFLGKSATAELENKRKNKETDLHWYRHRPRWRGQYQVDRELGAEDHMEEVRTVEWYMFVV